MAADRYVTRAEMREIDRRAIEDHHVPIETLMENAGRAVAEAAVDRVSPACQVVVVCGKGNNGGDGFVAARLLAEQGYEVDVLALKREYDRSTATGQNWEAAQECADFVGRFKKRSMALIIDAIFGTGLSREARGRERELIEEINRFDRRWFPVLSVDIPSGLDADSGRPQGVAVEASMTVTMGLPKTGFQKPEAKRYLGELVVADIGFPKELLIDPASKA